MVTNNAANIPTGAASTVLTGQGVGSSPTFSATPTLTSVTFGSGTALSVYAEGTFTPTVVGQAVAGTTTYTVQNGYYTKVGNVVFVWALVAGSGATGTGNALFGALPFTIKNQTNYIPTGSFMSQSNATWAWPAGSTTLSVQGNTNATTFTAAGTGTPGVAATLQMANAAFNFYYSFCYQV